MHSKNYIALGDSYTAGEGVAINESFPYQVVQKLRANGFTFNAPEIIARTGWTAEELELSIKTYKFNSKYDFATLLTGVNNQYRGKRVEEFKMSFENLLKLSIKLTDNKDRLYILSIPDYSKTPFAASLDVEKITKEIEVYNSVCKALSIQYKVQYIDLLTLDIDYSSAEMLVADKLHPSSKLYSIWADKLLNLFKEQLK
jgi:lysophospholipase L1-like esterase